MNKPLYFSKNEQTKQQRRDVVGFAVGVSLSQGRPPSLLMVALQERYIAGEIDLEELGARIDAEYLFAPGPDPYARYAPGAGPDTESTHVYEPYIELNLDDAPTTLS
jgi:Antitoxin VbhA